MGVKRPGMSPAGTGTGSRALALALGCALALVLAEAVVRWLDPPPRPLDPLEAPLYRLSDDPILLYEYRPRFRSGDAPFGHGGFETNSDGFRDDEHTLAKPPGSLRIAVLGDSIVAGLNNADRELIFSERLEALLNGGRGTGRYEVLNLGVGGYHTLQEVEMLRVKGLAYQPDVVLLTFCINDFNLASDGGVLRRLREGGDEGAAAPRSRLGRLLGASRLLFFAYHRLRVLLPPGPDHAQYQERFLGGRSNVEVGLALLAELQEQHGFRALVAIVPGFRGAFARYEHRDLHERVAEIAGRFPGLEVIDLLEDFRRLDPSGRAFSNDGIHPHPLGHAALAAILYEKLRARGIAD